MYVCYDENRLYAGLVTRFADVARKYKNRIVLGVTENTTGAFTTALFNNTHAVIRHVTVTCTASCQGPLRTQ